MFLTHSAPFLNFDHCIDVQGLLAIKPYISAFIAMNHHLLKPTKYLGSLFETGELGIVDYQQEFQKNPGIITDPKLQEIVADLFNNDQFGNYIIFERDVVMGTFSLVTRYATNYRTKQYSNSCVALPEDKQLEFFYQWLEKQDIFSDYGRVTMFINYPGTATAMHHDYPDPNEPNNDEFIWISPSPRKSFYLFNGDTNKKIYVPGYCNWFNTNNFHGSDPVTQACYSIRIDGVFSDTFRQRALNT